jgi:CxxC motif-containing protein (DUF1111 family)
MAHDPKYQAPGLDMSQAECDALIQFVRDLPRPRSQSTGTDKSDAYVAEGRTLFASVGCAACHVPTVGKAEGIYSDLLLHDMGQSLGDVGSSYGTLEHSRRSPSKPPKRLGAPLGGLDFAEKLKPEKRPNVAGPSEWRTPPLWGVRDSAPYLHDGRADTLQKAILLHDGEAQKSRELFDNLEFDEQQKVVAFLKSLAAPAE